MILLKDYPEYQERHSEPQPKLDAIAMSWKGWGLFVIGRFEEAIECYDKALQIKPNYALAQTNKQMVMKEKLT